MGYVPQSYIVISRVCDCVQRLRELQNFNTLMAVVGGLSHSSLARLGKTNACLPPDTQRVSDSHILKPSS